EKDRQSPEQYATEVDKYRDLFVKASKFFDHPPHLEDLKSQLKKVYGAGSTIRAIETLTPREIMKHWAYAGYMYERRTGKAAQYETAWRKMLQNDSQLSHEVEAEINRFVQEDRQAFEKDTPELTPAQRRKVAPWLYDRSNAF